MNTGVQRIVINNDIGATISSTTANAVNIQSALGDFNNSGNITGSENGIFVSENSSAVNITNTSTGTIKGKTGLSTQVGIGINNSGEIIGTNGDAITANDGNTKIFNSATVQGTQYGINVKDTAKLDIKNSGTISGETNAIMFASDKNNTLLLDTGSNLIGDVISTNSRGNTLTLIGTGSEDSNFVGLNEDDGFASVTM
ncbi:autotransporter outer membrane beta-barrel domain-containing protein, partial [Enterobacter hormaechei]